MSKYKYRLDRHLVICPYCENSYQPENVIKFEDGDVDDCEECGKRYRLRQVVTIHHETTPDCNLNGQGHEYEDMALGLGGGGKTHSFCTVCGKIEPLGGE